MSCGGSLILVTVMLASSADALTIPSLDVHWRDNTGLGLPLHCGVVRFENYPYWISEVYSVTNVQPVEGASDEYTANLQVPYTPSDLVCRVRRVAESEAPSQYSAWSNSLRYPKGSTLPTYVPEPPQWLGLALGWLLLRRMT